MSKTAVLAGLILLLVTILGGALRFYHLDQSPPSLNWDEAAFGYNAYSILKTGRDEYGKFLPFFTRSFDEYKPVLPIYLMIPFLLLFGVNEVGVRMLPAVSGVMTVLLIYLIARRLFKSEVTALLSAFFLAISPFAVFLSRVMFEGNLALVFFLLGYLFYLYRKKRRAWFLAIIFFVFSMYTYNGYKLLTPLFGMSLLWLSRKELIGQGKAIRQGIALSVVLLFPLLAFTLNGQALARFQSTSLFPVWSAPPTQLIPYFDLVWQVAGRYLGYFSPANLFVRESLEPGLIIPTLAVFYPFMFVFWLIGLAAVLRNYRKFSSLLWLIFLAPLPAVITWNWFQYIRVVPLLIAFTVLTGYGAQLCLDFIAGKAARLRVKPVLYGGLAAFGLWSAFYLFDCLMVLLPMNYFGNWQPGFKESIPIIASLQDKYVQIVIDTPHAQPHIFTLFYQAYPPARYLNEVDYEKISITPRQYYNFGKYSFRKIYWPAERSGHKTLFMGTVFSLPAEDVKSQPNATIVKDILDRAGNVIVRIVALD